MSQRPTPTGNPCLQSSFQKENRTLAGVAGAQQKRARLAVRGAMPNSATQPRRPNLVEPAI
jgi:hypothetical protein